MNQGVCSSTSPDNATLFKLGKSLVAMMVEDGEDGQSWLIIIFLAQAFFAYSHPFHQVVQSIY